MEYYSKEAVLERMRSKRENPKFNLGGFYAYFSISLILLSIVMFTCQGIIVEGMGNHIANTIENDQNSAVSIKNQTITIESRGKGSLVSQTIQHMNLTAFFLWAPFALLITSMLTIWLTVWPLAYRERWFYYTLWPLSIIYFLFIPIGTALAVPLMVHLSKNKSDYMPGNV